MGPAHSFLSNAILRGFKMYIIPCKCKKEKNRKRLYGKIYILSFAKQRKKLQIVLRDQWVSWYPAMFHVSQWNMHKLNYSLALATIDHMSLGLLLVLILAPEKTNLGFHVEWFQNEVRKASHARQKPFDGPKQRVFLRSASDWPNGQLRCENKRGPVDTRNTSRLILALLKHFVKVSRVPVISSFGKDWRCSSYI